MKKQKGFITAVLLLVVVLAIATAGFYTYKLVNLSLNDNPEEIKNNDLYNALLPEKNADSLEGSSSISNEDLTSASSSSGKTVAFLAPKNIPKTHNAFGFDLVKSIKKEEVNKNIFISPSSIAMALSMVYNGANGTTKTAMQKTLYLQNLKITDINQESLGLINSLKNPDPKIQLSVANSVWARAGIDFNSNFLGTVKDYYNAESSVLDFNNPDSVKTINTWVSKSTKGKIPTILDSIPEDVVMYLINAVYFKGSWTKAFEKKLTGKRNFTLADGSSKEISFMSKVEALPYLETQNFQSVKLDYENNKRLSMYVFLPKDLNNFVSTMTMEKWDGWMSSYNQKKGTLYLPKFKIEYEKQLKGVLSSLGMSVAFSDGADFSGIGKSLKISEVKHKSYVDVNEEGTEAAAVTSVGTMTTSVQPEPEDVFYMEVNHPFFFAIRDNQTGEILFMGIIQNP